MTRSPIQRHARSVAAIWWPNFGLTLVALLAATGWANPSVRLAAKETQPAALMKPSPRAHERDHRSTIVYALGDSTAAGVGASQGSYVDRLFELMKQRDPHLQLVNLSKSGATTADVLREQVPHLGDRRAGGAATKGRDAPAPALVLVGVGINDLVRRIPPEEFSQTYDRLISQIQRYLPVPVVISNLPDVSLVPAVMRGVRPEVAARVRVYNDRIDQVARQHGATVFDAAAFSQRMIPSHPDFVSADGFHPSDGGYDAWARQMWPVVQNVLMANGRDRDGE